MKGRPLALATVRIRHPDAIAPTPDGVTLTLEPGEVVLLLGPSGSGKSTLALAMNGLIPHAIVADLTGTVLVAGLDTRETPVARLSEHVGMVFQDPDAQIVTGTVLDEACFGPENLLLDADEVLQRAETALRAVGLWDRRRDSPDLLSGGQRQRLAIACALAMRAAVLVLDEPTANLDPAGVEDVYRTLAGLASAGQHSIVLIEHNLDAAVEIVDRVVVLDRDGRPVCDGSARAILADRAAELLGHGVWLPVATLAGLRLRAAGVPIEQLPLAPRELTAALDDAPRLPAMPAPAAETPAATAKDEPIITVRELTIARGGTTILGRVSLEVRAGEILAIVGTNGAGKTTLLQAIAGIQRASLGSVLTGGLDPAVARAHELSRAIGFVFQNPEHQFVAYTVADELAHSLHVLRVPKDDIEARVEAMLTRLDLATFRDRHPFLLSGGQKRRLSVGTALITAPPILALDEPTYGQDRERAAELMNLLTGLNAEGVTVLMVAHDIQLVAEHATRVAVLRGGQLLHEGPTAQVLAGDVLIEAGLRLPPLATATRALGRHPDWRRATRLRDLPEAPA